MYQSYRLRNGFIVRFFDYCGQIRVFKTEKNEEYLYREALLS